MTDAENKRRLMVARMVAAGSVRTAPWINAFTTVARHRFLPRFFRQTADHSGWEAVGEQDPDWLEMVYQDATWVTQLDNDPSRWETARMTGRPVRGVPTSSSTAPSLMALMVEALEVQDGHTVLEIGTGTGYNAALLCHRLGSRRVTTVEVDAVVAETARAQLLAVGCLPTVVVADGAVGHPECAPYDRILATCSAATIPPAWVDQLRPGGLLLTNLHRDLGGGALVLLERDAAGHGMGRFLPTYGGFMPLRRDPPADVEARHVAALATDETCAASRKTDLVPEELDEPDFGMLAALRLPGVASLWFDPPSGPQRWLLADDGSWACVDRDTQTVTQHGERRLWDAVEELHDRWRAAGRPARERFGLAVVESGAHLFWLDTSDHVWWTGAASGSVG